MTRIAALLLLEVAALGLVVVLPVELPWRQPSALVHLPEVAVAAGIIKAAACVTCGWLLVSTVAYAIVSPLPRLRQALGRVTAPVVRRVVDTALAASMALGTVGPVMAAEAPPEPIVVTIEEDESGNPIVLPPGVSITAVLDQAVDDLDAPTSPITATHVSPPTTTVARSPVTRPAPTTPLPASVDETTYQVRPGDHLWSIAEQVLQQRTGRAIVPDHVIAPFWRRIIDLNHGTLRSGNPDLIYPGEILTIPDS